MISHEVRRVKVQVEINVLPRQTAGEVIEWVNKFFAFFHPNLEARVTTIDKTAFVEEPVDGLALLGGDEPVDGLALLGEAEAPGTPPGADLLS